eukprot:403361244
MLVIDLIFAVAMVWLIINIFPSANFTWIIFSAIFCFYCIPRILTYFIYTFQRENPTYLKVLLITRIVTWILYFSFFAFVTIALLMMSGEKENPAYDDGANWNGVVKYGGLFLYSAPSAILIAFDAYYCYILKSMLDIMI